MLPMQQTLDPEGSQQILTKIANDALDACGLTVKERDVARLVLKSYSYDEIAAITGNSPKTIKYHVGHIYDKCGCRTRPEFFAHVFPV